MKYDPATGIFGMDFYVVLARPGFRVARRKHCTARVGRTHRITKSDSQAWFKVRGLAKFGALQGAQ
jgi:large subunit ribosomal protein L11e